MTPETVQHSRSTPLSPQGARRGLTDEAAAQSQVLNGKNIFRIGHSGGVLVTLKEVVTAPMFLLLLAACAVYLALGQPQEAMTLGGALLLVSGISVYQSVRSDRALLALHDLTQPRAQLWRSGVLLLLPTEEIVVGDAVLIEEGSRVPADGIVHDPHDFTVDESMLTGESTAVSKSEGHMVYAGTHAATGHAWMSVTATGPQTQLGHIGRSLSSIPVKKSPLQQQVNTFVLRMALIGVVAFGLVWGLNYARSGDAVGALLFGLTLAMSILPEEIPVALSSFMALGAARLGRIGVLTKQPQTVESLGAATIICADKTGTLTQEGMTVGHVYAHVTGATLALRASLSPSAVSVLTAARWASESEPFDAMDRAIVAAYAAHDPTGAARTAPLIHEYPLDGTPPMMTHIRDVAGQQVVAAKGAVERVLSVCRLDAPATEAARRVAHDLATRGYRVLGVAQATPPSGPYPARQDDFSWTFLGLVALENPPKANAKAVIQAFSTAQIQVKMITGDSLETAQAIARQVGLPGADRTLTGPQVMALDRRAQTALFCETAVFARMFPEAKLKVVQALQLDGAVVAMTGDGVNDGPALKAANIGVAMGRRGTEVARQAASLVLVNDDLSAMLEAVAQGRRIYQNLQKAVGYIVSIHVPIVLTVTLPLLLGWPLENLMTPIHIIMLELVMGPTCSVAFENEPAESGQMERPPRSPHDQFLAGPALTRSILQGLSISAAVLSVYWAAMTGGAPADVVRTLVFTALVLSNIFLVLVSRSFTLPSYRTLCIPNRALWLMLGLTLATLLITLFYSPAQHLFGFAPMPLAWLCWCVLSSLIGVGWIEGVKLIRTP